MAQTMEQLQEHGEEESPGRSRRKLVVLLALGAAVLGLVAFWLLTGPSDDEEVAEDVPEEDGAVVEISDLTANLRGDQLRYARVSMAAVLRVGADAGAVERRFPVLKDAALTELTGMTPDELRSTEGLEELRSRMTAHARKVYPDGEVLRILITELVVQ
jgi:flagellar protein FliL